MVSDDQYEKLYNAGLKLALDVSRIYGIGGLAIGALIGWCATYLVML